MPRSVRSLSLAGTALASVGALVFATPAISANAAPAPALNLTAASPAIALLSSDHGYGYGGPGPRGWGHERGPGGWGGGGGRWWRGGLALALRRLQATPDQEQVIREELDKLGAAFREHREEWSASRHDVAEAIRNESFDATTMGELFGRHDERLEELRKAVMEALGRIHAVLDDTQRQRLAEMIDRGRGGWHPFRGGMA